MSHSEVQLGVHVTTFGAPIPERLSKLPFGGRTKWEYTRFSACKQYLLSIFGERKFSVVYVGSELCYKIRKLDSSELNYVSKLLQQGYKVAYVLPVVTQAYFYKVERLERQLEDLKPELTIVANDWGTARYFAQKGYKVEAGRFLCRVKRMPRAIRRWPTPAGVGEEEKERVKLKQIETLQQNPYASKRYFEVLTKLGIRSVQVEIVPQGMSGKWLLPATLLLPWTYITGGVGACPFYSRALDSCGYQCSRSIILPRYPGMSADIVQVGGTAFYGLTRLIPQFVTMQGVSTVVVESGLPVQNWSKESAK